MLKEEVLRLEWSEGDTEFGDGSWLDCRRLRVHLKCSHVIPVKVLSFLRNPVNSHLAGEAVSYQELLLAADGHDVAMPEVDEVCA